MKLAAVLLRWSEVLVGPALAFCKGPLEMGTTLRKHLLSILYPGLILIALQPATHAQGIIATRTPDGRVVYENAPAEAEAARPANPDSGLVYWSNTQHRWKPVPAMNTYSMRAAQSAAEEVRRMIRHAAHRNPELAANGNALLIASEQVQSPPPAESKPHRIASVAEPAAPAPVQAPKGSGWIDGIVEQAALRHAVDPNLVRAIIKVESNFNPQAVSRKGAIGLMQLMPGTAKSLNVHNPYDPAQNVDAGVRHFKELLDSYHGNLELSLAAYNAGPGAVQKSRGVPKYPETQNYVKRITGLYGANAARLFASGRPLEFKRDANGHLTISNLE